MDVDHARELIAHFKFDHFMINYTGLDPGGMMLSVQYGAGENTFSD